MLSDFMHSDNKHTDKLSAVIVTVVMSCVSTRELWTYISKDLPIQKMQKSDTQNKQYSVMV